jgi:hypothetical protein
MKVIVRVKTPAYEYSRKRKIESDGKTVKMDKNWKFTIPDGALTIRPGFWRPKYLVDVWTDAPVAMKLHPKMEESQIPFWDKPTSLKWIKAKILERAAQEPKEKTNTLMWILVILGIGNIVLTLISSGRIRIG